MKTVLVAAALTLAAGDAFAISRYNSMGMSCAEAQARIDREGAVIMRYRSRSGVPLYGRYVSDGRFCEASTRPEFRSIPTADTRYCDVLECEYYDLDDDVFILGR
ncbi:hypothetical protein RB623_20630 [Mesorhizobium sp. LHD-90]|uniref:hypothetical protein n=1 Tax=Mesorhizobium sp. LHD-90 TaxID=3071414 RepID=UPI0027DFF060|nr:hypothetical protein [Mesorhizobium sp. LHD-90]MDQ6436462.1 hypothetical protein [Mesorhizobium sp. LHD-90]